MCYRFWIPPHPQVSIKIMLIFIRWLLFVFSIQLFRTSVFFVATSATPYVPFLKEKQGFH